MFFTTQILNGEEVEAADFDHLATFTYREERLTPLFKRVAVSLVSMVAVAFVASLMALRFDEAGS